MHQSELLFTPANPLQEQFIWNTYRESVFDGGVGNGKTSGGVLRLLVLASMYPKSRWVIFRETYKDLRATTYKTFEKLCPESWLDPRYGARNVKEETRLPNGAEILWMHLDETSEQALSGLEINGAFGDQIEEINPEKWELLESRIGRWQMPELWPEPCPSYIWGTSNPKGKDWIYYRFHPNAREHRIRLGDDRERLYLFGETSINKDLLNKIAPGYYDNLMRKPESWKKIWVYGSREFFEGSIFPEAREAVHVYDPSLFNPFKNRKIRTVCGWFDYGLAAPSCLLLSATDNEGFHYIWGEYYGNEPKISLTAQAMQRMISKSGVPCQAVWADPTIFIPSTRDRKVVTTTVAEEYAQQGINMVKADNGEESSIERLHELLDIQPSLPNPITGEKGSPRLFFSKSCPFVFSQLQQARRKEWRNPLTGEKEFLDERDPGVPDHALDALRYFANSKVLGYTPYTGPIHTTNYNTAPSRRTAERGYR